MLLKRRHITLLEVIIVMALVGMIAGVAGIGINRALIDQRFRTEASVLLDELRMAQDLMMILNTDVHVKFAALPNNQGIEYWLESEIALSPSIQKQLFQHRRLLKSIRGIFFEDEYGKKVMQGELDLRFFSRGAIISRGILRVSISGEDHPPANILQSYIPLPGYVRPLIMTDSLQIAENVLRSSDDEFARALTQDTFAKIPDNLKKSEEAPAEKPPADKQDNPDANPKSKP